MNEQEYTFISTDIRKRRFSESVCGLLLTCATVTGCSQSSSQECGQTVELNLESGPSAFLSFEDIEYSLFVADSGIARKVGLSKGKSIEEQFNNELYEDTLEADGNRLSGSVEIDGVKVSFITAVGSDTAKVYCSKLD